MIANKEPIRLLLIDDSADNTERIAELFRAAGHAVQAQQITSLDTLNAVLQCSWDVCITAHSSNNLTPAMIQQSTQHLADNLVRIQLMPDNSATSLAAALQYGVQDAVCHDDEQRLLFVTQRELSHLAERRQRRAAETALRKTRQRVIASTEMAAKLRDISNQDIVTGLYNRQHFLQHLDAAAERAINLAQPACLAYLKVDHYLSLQADLGITGIDLLFIDLAMLLRQQLSTHSHIARFADNAFCVIIPDITAELCQTELLNLMQAVEAQLFEIHGRTTQTTLSIGVALLSEQTANASVVLKRAQNCADQLTQGNALKIHNPADDLAAAAKRGDIVAMLHQALAQNSLTLLFQPIVGLHAKQDELYEAQWQLLSPHGQQVPAAECLHAAASAGVAGTIDRWLLLNAIKRLTEQHKQGLLTRLFIPLSSASLEDRNILPWLRAALKASRLPAHTVILQLRETDVISHLKQAKHFTNGLHQLHCQVALEQFGCAPNPFNTLKHIALDYVKIDDSFSAKLDSIVAQQTLKDLLITLHTHGKQSIVSGINSASVLPTLWQARVNYIQGDYLQSPSQTMSYNFCLEEK
ncbi:EAL domain-containing protein [Denitrificimonas caeni]|uniref:EAL domain-containing protein n=1 Tax=Denitrificimonas caeni TaxID=521720 RepID=UPI001964FC13|nr:EAL domain-containing protein [Denitrificimonas caeni]